MKKRRVLGIILVLLWMVLVFYLSHEPASVSSNTSGSVIKWIIEIFNKDLPEDTLESVVSSLQNIVRKCAHFGLYAVGGVLLYNMYSNIVGRDTVRALSIVTGIFYACTDEIHQFFVIGRSAEIRDVCIDSIGVIIGVLLVCTIDRIVTKIQMSE